MGELRKLLGAPKGGLWFRPSLMQDLDENDKIIIGDLQELELSKPKMEASGFRLIHIRKYCGDGKQKLRVI